MSQPLSVLLDAAARLAARRAEARIRARLKRLSEGVRFDGLVHLPAARDFGDFNAARAVLKGELAIGGYRAALRDLTPWDVALPSPRLSWALHGFAWLDDFEALGGKQARARAQGWTLGWIDRFADGAGPGWAPHVVAGRLRRLLTQLDFLAKGLAEDRRERIEGLLPLHVAYLAETWEEEADDAPRLAALCGLLTGAVCLAGQGAHVSRALESVAGFCDERITAQGGLACRNPEALLSVFRDLLAIRAVLADTGRRPLPQLEDALQRIAPTLRALRHGDGRLARFHGASGGGDGVLDRALAEARIRTRPTDAPAMGFVRLHGGRVTVIADCARPPERSDTGHASTLGFEMSSGRRPVIVNTGPAVGHMPDWARAARTTAAHNTLALDKTSSSRLGPARVAGRPGFDALQTRPSLVSLARAEDASGMWIQVRHDGYLEDYGLVHERRLFVGSLGHQVHGEDVLLSPDEKSRRRFASRIRGASKLGVGLAIHFHLHPEVEAELIRQTDSVRLRLKSGEVWLFRHEGGLMDLEASVYLDPALAAPLPARQIVVRSRATTHSAQISWSLLRENVAPRAPRDVAGDLGIDTGSEGSH
ncbi:heparinase [Halovulum dunhuangense]|uniref:Heparinase n=1 Tax=Halovulum dunhuangense TaxID=1505036 RepID=A0A849KXY9_9RHOB|nr:heparinase II/III family protein [Halovulum dunhuangense]NNU79577.1 heparinase [Halovulum dunhuangense]